jgi:hypothetical protein
LKEIFKKSMMRSGLQFDQTGLNALPSYQQKGISKAFGGFTSGFSYPDRKFIEHHFAKSVDN